MGVEKELVRVSKGLYPDKLSLAAEVAAYLQAAAQRREEEEARREEEREVLEGFTLVKPKKRRTVTKQR